MTTKVLITGGAGYLGSVLTMHLLSHGYQVTVVDNFRHGVPSLLAFCSNRNLEIVNKDCRHCILEHSAKADVLIPLAAVVGAPACDRDIFAAEDTNLEAVRTLCGLASNDQTIIYPNTNSGYGTGGAGPCHENDPINPLSLYAQTKAEAESIVLSHPRGVSLRFATLFGCSPRMRLDLLVNDFVYRAVRDRSLTLFEPHFRRNYLHVRDAARVFEFAIEHAGEMCGKAFNAGLSSANLSKHQLCEKIREHLPDFTWTVAPNGKDPDQRDYLVSNARLEALGWRPMYPLDVGIEELIRAFQAMPFEGYRN